MQGQFGDPVENDALTALGDFHTFGDHKPIGVFNANRFGADHFAAVKIGAEAAGCHDQPHSLAGDDNVTCQIDITTIRRIDTCL